MAASGPSIGICDVITDNFYLLRIDFLSAPRESVAKVMREVLSFPPSEFPKHYPDWSYSMEFFKACGMDRGDVRKESTDAFTRVSCERDGRPFWEYIEAYVDLDECANRPVQQKKTIFYRALALAPSAD